MGAPRFDLDLESMPDRTPKTDEQLENARVNIKAWCVKEGLKAEDAEMLIFELGIEPDPEAKKWQNPRSLGKRKRERRESA